jgi:PEP-CTERM motif
MLASFADLAVGLADSFSFSNVIPFADPNLYSMSMGTSGTLAAWNGVQGQETTLVGRNQAMVTLQAVPEPGTLALAGLGLMGLGFTTRKKYAA